MTWPAARTPRSRTARTPEVTSVTCTLALSSLTVVGSAAPPRDQTPSRVAADEASAVRSRGARPAGGRKKRDRGGARGPGGPPHFGNKVRWRIMRTIVRPRTSTHFVLLDIRRRYLAAHAGLFRRRHFAVHHFARAAGLHVDGIGHRQHHIQVGGAASVAGQFQTI